MIVKNLREKKGWTQEQLAQMCGLNVRTIQRVESGNKASLETLKSLSSVFEVEISKLTEEITVIDKTTEEWKSLPWWFRANMYGVHRKKPIILVEVLTILCGFIFWIFKQSPEMAAIMFLGAYLTGWIVRYGDNHKVWNS